MVFACDCMREMVVGCYVVDSVRRLEVNVWLCSVVSAVEGG